MANAFFYSNNAQQTTLSGSISAGATSVSVGATTGFPGSFPYVLALDYGAATEELVSVTAAAGTTLTVTRGYGGTSAQSHSLGAVVRHVYNAQDATDFRTHEAATAAIHGVAGTLVGTSDVQTLSNKTLTAPTINAGALSGTFTGTPTFSGAATFTGSTTAISASGEIGHTNLYRGSRGLATDSQMESRVTGDSVARWFTQADGKHFWGPGNAAVDTNLYRAAANSLKTDDDFTSVGTILATPSSGSADGLSSNLPSGTTGDLLNLRVNSAIQAAMGSDGAFRIYGGNTPATYTPTITNGGTVTWTSRTGFYWKMGKIVFVCVYLVVNAAGSGNGILMVDMPSNVDRTMRQALTVHAETVGVNGNGASTGGTIRGGECVFFTGGTGATSDRLRVDDSDGDGENNIQGVDLKAGALITIQGWYREA